MADRAGVERQTYLVEHYRPGLGVEGFRRCALEVRGAAAELAREGKAVRYLRSTIVPADEALLCVLEAADEELVRETYARAGVPFERLSAVVHETTHDARAVDIHEHREEAS
jgi:Protein of unknown function (DUF4242)